MDVGVSTVFYCRTVVGNGRLDKCASYHINWNIRHGVHECLEPTENPISDG